MNQTIKTILTRRSIRSFKNTTVSESDIKLLLQAAMQAPTAGDSQEWRFFVITDKKIIAQIAKNDPQPEIIENCPLLILICANLKEEKFKDFFEQNCAAAAQNILLAAHSLELGAVWLGVHKIKERVDLVKKVCKLAKHVVPVMMIVIGDPDEIVEFEDRFDEGKVVFEN